MARLPSPGADTGTWGTILNTFLDVSFDDSGTIVASTATITGQTSLQNVTVGSIVMDNFRSTGTGSVHFLNVTSEALINQLSGASRWTDIACISHANTTVTVSAAAISLTAECHLTIKSPSDPQSVPSQLMVDSVVADTSFMIVANVAVQSACPVMFTIVR